MLVGASAQVAADLVGDLAVAMLSMTTTDLGDRSAPARPPILMPMRYPVLEPFDSGVVEAGSGHRVSWERVGNPHGKPAVVLHGGPGSGAQPWWRAYFDPTVIA